MSALSYTHAATLLNNSLRSGTYYLALFLTNPTASDNGGEVVGGGYARKQIVFSAPKQVSERVLVANSGAIDFGVITADIGTVSYWGIYDDATAGELKWFGSFQRARSIVAGDAITILDGAIVCALS